MISASDLTASELAALLHFHADAGVSWLLEEEPVDRFAEFEALKASRQAARPAPAPLASQSQAPAAAEARSRAQAAPPPAARAPAIPDEQAVEQARFAAESARSLPELKVALEGFNGCNLKNSARSTLFAGGNAESRLMIIGPMPSADDDRDGSVFAGRAGQLLDRMLASIGLDRQGVLLTNVIPWRPPGNRAPSPLEVDICKPFIERQIALAEPRLVLLLGNFTARFFFGGNETINGLRGQWRDIAVGDSKAPAIATLHPQDLLTAPINKRLAWQDLLAYRQKADELNIG